jgi:hypothetical protein
MHTNELPGGWIYILLSSADYTRCKIGRTSKNPLVRYRQLRTGDPCLGLVVAYYIPEQFGPVERFEASIHLDFREYRINNHEDSKSEWFRIRYSLAEQLIDCMLEDWCGQKIHYFGTVDFNKLSKMYESDIQALFEPDPRELQLARFYSTD